MGKALVLTAISEFEGEEIGESCPVWEMSWPTGVGEGSGISG